MYLILAAWLLAVPGALADEPTMLLVRVDDRRARALVQPWLTVLYADGTTGYVPIPDDGSDPDDAFPGDRLFITRATLAQTGPIRVWVTDGGPLSAGRVVYQTDLVAASGRVHRVSVRDTTAKTAPQADGQGGSSAGGQEGAPSSTGVAGGGPRLEAKGEGSGVVQDGNAPVAQADTQEFTPPSSGVPLREDTLRTPVPFSVADWSWLDRMGAILALVGLWWGQRRLRHMARESVRRIDDLAWLLDGTWRHGRDAH